jgi:hypothetical protein
MKNVPLEKLTVTKLAKYFLRPILIISSYLRLRLPSHSFTSYYNMQKLCVFMFSSMRAKCSTQIIIFDLVTLSRGGGMGGRSSSYYPRQIT